MHLSPSKPQEGKIYYIAKSFRNDRGVSTKKNVRRLGTLAEIREREGVSDAWAWAKSQLETENSNDAMNQRAVTIRLHAGKIIGKDHEVLELREHFSLFVVFFSKFIDQFIVKVDL